MLVLAVAAAAGVLAGPFSVVIPLAIQGVLWLAGQLRLLPAWTRQDDFEPRHELRMMQIQLGSIELVSVWAAVSLAGYSLEREGHYLVAGGPVAVVAAATTVALVGTTRAFNNALVALVPAATAASVAAAVAGRLVL